MKNNQLKQAKAALEVARFSFIHQSWTHAAMLQIDSAIAALDAPVQPQEQPAAYRITTIAPDGESPLTFLRTDEREAKFCHASFRGSTLEALYAAPVQPASKPDAHELWAAAQIAPGEGIDDAARRIERLLARCDTSNEAACPTCIGHGVIDGPEPFSNDPSKAMQACPDCTGSKEASEAAVNQSLTTPNVKESLTVPADAPAQEPAANNCFMSSLPRYALLAQQGAYQDETYMVESPTGDYIKIADALAAQPAAQRDDATQAVIEAHQNYERFGAVCEFEGQPMIYAATLEELAEKATAAQPAPARDAQIDAVIALQDRLALIHRLCCGLSPKQAVGEMVAVMQQMPEWEVLRNLSSQPAQEAAPMPAQTIFYAHSVDLDKPCFMVYPEKVFRSWPLGQKENITPYVKLYSAPSVPAQAVTDEPTTVEIDREGARFWHRNCANHLGGVMQEVRREPGRSLIQCRHCGKCGYYPVGGVGLVNAEEAYIWNNVTDRLPAHGQLIRGRSHNGEWNEVFNSREPIGFMTEWRLLSGSAKTQGGAA